MKHFEEDTDKESTDDHDTYLLSVTDIYSTYKDYCDTQQMEPLSANNLGRYVFTIFPNTSVVKRTLDTKWQTNYYKGLKMTPLTEHATIELAIHDLRKQYDLIIVENTETILHTLFPKKMHDKTIYLHLYLTIDEVKITFDDQIIDLERLQFPSKIDMDYHGVMATGRFLHQLKLCGGKVFNAKSAVLAGSVTLENFSGTKVVRSTRCKRIMQVLGTDEACVKCREASAYCTKKKVSVWFLAYF